MTPPTSPDATAPIPTVREALQIGFLAAPTHTFFYVADVEASGPAIDGEVHVGMDTTDFLAVFPLKRAIRN